MSIFVRHKFKILLLAVAVIVTAAGVLVSSGPVASKEAAPEKPSTAWAVRCNKDTDKRCEMFQRLVIQETGQRVAEFAIGFPEDKTKARGVLILPLGMLLPDGGKMQIDDNPPFKFQMRFCSKDGCFAYLNLNEKILGMMRKGNEAKITFKSLQGQDMNVTMSLSGFTKSLDEISSS